MSLRAFEPLDESRFTEICAQRTAESQTLDFKQALPGNSDRDKGEFLKDICALANADGGDLVYGIAESGGVATRPSPITAEAPDGVKRRLGQVADAGLEPRVIGLQFREIAVTGGYILVVRVPASFNGPHRYTVSGVSRFSKRSGTHTTEMTYEQLRSAFDRTATLAERARRFREARLASIATGSTWRPMRAGPLGVVHLIPISAMGGGTRLDIQRLYNNALPFVLKGWGGFSNSTNLDGLIVHGGTTQGGLNAYTQVFRSGALEAVRTAVVTIEPERKLIPSTAIGGFFREAIEKFLDQSRALGFSGPAIIGIALLGVTGYGFAVGNRMFGIDSMKADRDNLILPEVWLDDIEGDRNLDAVAHPLLDMLWQAFDVERCVEYDSQGVWRPR